MTRICRLAVALLALSEVLVFGPGHAQAPGGPPAAGPGADHGPQRPSLFFREEWKQGPGGGEHAVTAASLANANLELTPIVPAGQIEVTGTAGDEGNPVHVWQGLALHPAVSRCATSKAWPI